MSTEKQIKVKCSVIGHLMLNYTHQAWFSGVLSLQA